MAKAQSGDSVRVHYTGTLDSGEVFDSSQGGDPLPFTLGEQQVIPGFETAVLGMQPGESKTIKIPCDDAYGPPREEMVLTMERSQLPAEITPEVGVELAMEADDGQPIPVKVTAVSDSSVTLDANHPLAGQDLTFKIELVGID